MDSLRKQMGTFVSPDHGKEQNEGEPKKKKKKKKKKKSKTKEDDVFDATKYDPYNPNNQIANAYTYTCMNICCPLIQVAC